jgi:hypothetical protein
MQFISNSQVSWPSNISYRLLSLIPTRPSGSIFCGPHEFNATAYNVATATNNHSRQKIRLEKGQELLVSLPKIERMIPWSIIFLLSVTIAPNG